MLSTTYIHAYMHTYIHTKHRYIKTKFTEFKREKFVMGNMVKDRQEPAHVVNICEVLAAVRGVPFADLAAATYSNTMRVLFSLEK
jgi:TatD DNase family protein